MQRSDYYILRILKAMISREIQDNTLLYERRRNTHTLLFLLLNIRIARFGK